MLTPEQIMELEQQSYVKAHRPVRTEDCWGDEKITYEPTEHFNMFMFARAIEAEVRKQDDALIRQMHDALCECAEDSQEQLDRMEAAKLRQYKPQAVAYQEATIDAAKMAITAARARLGEKT